MPLPPFRLERISAAFLALLLGYFFLLAPIRDSWTRYWLLKDGLQRKALVTKVLWTGHNVVDYRYRVNAKDYTGEDAAPYANRVVGGEPAVFYSASHPWLSRLSYPQTAMVEGLPVLLLAWFFIALFAITAINPSHKWAMNIGGQHEDALKK